LKILCISDQIDPQVYSPLIKERFSDVDFVLSAGDLPLDYLDYIISCLNKPLFFVFGNHHTDELMYFRNVWNMPHNHEEKEYFSCGAVHLGSTVKIENNVIITGLGGCKRYNRGQNQFSEFEMFWEIFKIIPGLLWNRIFRGRFLDILLTHAPPSGIHDKKDRCHQGFKIFLWFMKVFKPKYLVHGHIHLYDLSAVRSTKFLSTTVINAYSHYLINLGE